MGEKKRGKAGSVHFFKRTSENSQKWGCEMKNRMLKISRVER